MLKQRLLPRYGGQADGGMRQQQCFSLQLRPGVKVLGGGEEENGPNQCWSLSTEIFSKRQKIYMIRRETRVSVSVSD